MATAARCGELEFGARRERERDLAAQGAVPRPSRLAHPGTSRTSPPAPREAPRPTLLTLRHPADLHPDKKAQASHDAPTYSAAQLQMHVVIAASVVKLTWFPLHVPAAVSPSPHGEQAG